MRKGIAGYIQACIYSWYYIGERRREMTAYQRLRKFIAQCKRAHKSAPKPPASDYSPIWEDIRSITLAWLSSNEDGSLDVVVAVDCCSDEEIKWLLKQVRACGFTPKW